MNRSYRNRNEIKILTEIINLIKAKLNNKIK